MDKIYDPSCKSLGPDAICTIDSLVCPPSHSLRRTSLVSLSDKGYATDLGRRGATIPNVKQRRHRVLSPCVSSRVRHGRICPKARVMTAYPSGIRKHRSLGLSITCHAHLHIVSLTPAPSASTPCMYPFIKASLRLQPDPGRTHHRQLLERPPVPVLTEQSCRTRNCRLAHEHVDKSPHLPCRPRFPVYPKSALPPSLPLFFFSRGPLSFFA